jgi:hypothetical protein
VALVDGGGHRASRAEPAMTAQQFDIVALCRWVGGPGGHAVELGIVAFAGAEPVWVDGSLERMLRFDVNGRAHRAMNGRAPVA